MLMTDTPAPATRELRGRIGSCVEHGAAAEFYDDGSGLCIYCCQVETSCYCTEEARTTPAEALDVERLARILKLGNIGCEGHSVGAYHLVKDHAEDAAFIAAEYARLRSSESDR